MCFYIFSTLFIHIFCWNFVENRVFIQFWLYSSLCNFVLHNGYLSTFCPFYQGIIVFCIQCTYTRVSHIYIRVWAKVHRHVCKKYFLSFFIFKKIHKFFWESLSTDCGKCWIAHEVRELACAMISRDLSFALSPSCFATAPSRREPFCASIFEGGGTACPWRKEFFISPSPPVTLWQPLPEGAFLCLHLWGRWICVA